MRSTLTLTLTPWLLASLLASATWADGDPAAGEQKAKVCAACHGLHGISAVDIWPNLAGQKEGYLVKQIKAFQDGTRVDASMAPMVKPLTEQDIKDLAAYYSRL